MGVVKVIIDGRMRLGDGRKMAAFGRSSSCICHKMILRKIAPDISLDSVQVVGGWEP